MGLKIILAGLCGAAIAATAVVVVPADAQAPRRETVAAKKQTVAKKRSRIVVQPRSYLDAGTEVKPGQRKFTDYAIPPNYSVTAPIDNTAFSRRPYPTAGGIWPGNW
jgi:hypothetical protein